MSMSDNVIMTWERMWTYYKSSLCSPEQREFILKSFSLKDALEIATPLVQIEILEYAPMEVKRTPDIQPILSMEVKRKLGISNPLLTQEDKSRLRERFMRT